MSKRETDRLEAVDLEKLEVEKVLEYPGRVYRFYRDGFLGMTLGKTLWKIIIIKLVVMFAVLKLFFFPNYLKTNFTTDQDRADYVIDRITIPAKVQ
ncbi:DUF4492 domain-containing protein [Desulfosediminicola sp.]|uniref:DUF4492 domain-containing protein n=1 Tax=Desulfosediminicola sp. TaxID=2886825 RepID=UPI003AF30E15